MNDVFGEILNADGYFTVFDSETLPQYLEYDLQNDELSPLTEDAADIADTWKPDFLLRLVNVLRYIFQKIADILKNIDFTRGR